MEVVGRFATSIEAMHFVAYLREAGIPDARIFNQGEPYPGLLGIDVAVGSADAARGRSLFDEFKRTPPTRGLDPEDAKPDLSLLDESLAPPCPGCGRTLPLEDISRCPRCGAGVDVAELIVGRHGPEALAPCYPPPLTPDEEAPDLQSHCPSCAYSLVDLPRTGVCPECGLPFDKARPPGTW
jgi:hypothetical protein